MKKVFVAACVMLSLNSFSQKVSGKLNFPKSQKLEMVTETNKTATMELMGQSMESTVNSTMTEVFDISGTDGNGANIEHKVKHLVFTANGMGNSQSFDSEKEDDRKGEMGKIMEKSLKNKYTMSVDPTGKITAIKLDDDNPNGTKNDKTDAMAELASTQLGVTLGLPKPGDASIFKILPDKEITTGDSWTDSSSANGQKRRTVYTVKSITDKEVTLDYTEDINVNTTQEIMGTQASIKSDDKVTGQVIIDRATGLLKQKTATMDTNATMEAQGMTIPSTGKTTITVTVKPA
jgi:hypothetical protein